MSISKKIFIVVVFLLMVFSCTHYMFIKSKKQERKHPPRLPKEMTKPKGT